jgi:hypothetical protein
VRSVGRVSVGNGVEVNLWEEIPEEPEYIQVCDSYQLAAMLGIIGVIIGIALTFLNEAIWFNYYENPEFDLEMLSILFNMLNPIGFVGGILVSVGFVGVFAMKKSTVGILFPLIFLASLFISRILFWISISISIDSYLFIINNVQPILSFVFAIIGGLALLSIRKTSANTNFLYTFAALYMFGGVLIWAIYLLFYGVSIPIEGGLSRLVAILPNLVLGLTISCMTVIFFTLERRLGCIKGEEWGQL